MRNTKKPVNQITEIIHNHCLARAICASIEAGLDNASVHIMGKSTWDVFKYSLDTAIRDIETHPRGKLFRRFLDYGPPNPDNPHKMTSDGETMLSDPECGECIQFIYSHMVNRFKGELAELLAILPCLEVMDQLREERKWPGIVALYLGDTIQERRQIKQGDKLHWGEFTKGADGLLVEKTRGQSGKEKEQIKVHGIVEIKSMPRSDVKLHSQLNHHLDRLRGGMKLEGQAWEGSHIVTDSPSYIMVIPSNWKLSRECYYENNRLVYPGENKPPTPTKLEKKPEGHWKITLDWSKEALEQAAYEMTYWYMSQVGTAIYSKKELPKGWEGMTPEEAGYNAIKMMLYYAMLCYITPQQGQRATKLYNAYSFGYPSAMDAKDMLWPDKIPNREKKS